MFKLGDIQFGSGAPLVLIAGPCVIESRELVLQIAGELSYLSIKHNIPLIFKASFDKANRSSLDAFRGPGLEEGLEILQAVKDEFGLPILTDVHLPEQCVPVAEVADILQIPAFLSRQTDLLVATAKTGAVINIKKGQFMSPVDVKNAVLKVTASGNKRVFVTDRGVSFGYNRLISDMRAATIIKEFAPAFVDITHSLQQPSGLGGSSGGEQEFIVPLARAAVASGVDGIFMEVHPNPKEGLSDATTMFKLGEMDKFLVEITQLAKLIRSFE